MRAWELFGAPMLFQFSGLQTLPGLGAFAFQRGVRISKAPRFGASDSVAMRASRVNRCPVEKALSHDIRSLRFTSPITSGGLIRAAYWACRSLDIRASWA